MSANSVPDLPNQNQPNPATPGPQDQHGFRVPPAGGEQSHQYSGQTPGWVPNRGQDQSQEQPKPQQQQTTPAKADGLDLAAILQAALGKPAEQQNPAPVAKPDWMPDSVNQFNVDEIDDPIIKSMASVLKVAGDGLDLDRVLGNALALGDPNLVDVAYIAEKGGANAQQIAAIAKGIVDAVNAKSQAITNEIHALAGGEAQWAQSAAVFNQAAPEELKLVVKAMLDSTNSQKIKAGAKIVTEFGRASGQLPKAGANLLNSASAGMANANGLSAAAFKAEIAKLDPQKPDYLEARNDLFQRRAVGKRNGL